MIKLRLKNAVYVVSEWIMRFSALHLLWLFCNLPVVFILSNMLYVDQIMDKIMWLPILFLITPTLLFPATQAMFALVRDWILKKESNGLIKPYFLYYKKNYKKSLIGGLILTVVWFIWGVDFYYSTQQSNILMIVFSITGIFLYVYTINYFSISSHYNIGIVAILKNTLLITLGYPILFLGILLGTSFIIFISFKWFTFLIAFFTASLIAYVSFVGFYKVYMNSRS